MHHLTTVEDLVFALICVRLDLSGLPHLTSSHCISGQFTQVRVGWTDRLLLSVWFHSVCKFAQASRANSFRVGSGCVHPLYQGVNYLEEHFLRYSEMGSFWLLHTQFWETSKKMNIISWIPDNPLVGVKARQFNAKPTETHEPRVHPVQTPVFSLTNALHSRKQFSIIIPSVPHKVVILFPL